MSESNDHWALRHPAALLTTVAAVGGAVLGFAHGGLVGAAIVSAGWAALTATIAVRDPCDAVLGPHQ